MVNEIYDLATVIAQGSLDIIKQHGFVVGFLAVLGLVSILGAVFSQAWKALKYVFYAFFALPLIIVIGLMKRSDRKERLKELGEIRAFAMSHPDRMKKMLFYLLAIIFILVVLTLLYYFAKNYLFPIYQFNEATKIILNNSNVSIPNFTNSS